MKIIKRNGTEVAFDISKIVMAISKANIEVDEKVRLTPVQIDRIAESGWYPSGTPLSRF